MTVLLKERRATKKNKASLKIKVKQSFRELRDSKLLCL